jgi:cysteine synthase A
MVHVTSPSQGLLLRINQLGRLLRPTPLVAVDFPGLHLYAKLEYANPIGSVKDRTAYWILRRAIERGDIDAGTTIIESSSGNFAAALATYAKLLGLQFIPVIDPHIVPSNEAFLRRMCRTVIKVDRPDESGGYLKSRLQAVQELCAATPQSFWPNQYANTDGMDAHYDVTAEEICGALPSIDYAFMGVSSAGTIAGISRKLKERRPGVTIVAVDAVGSVIFGGAAQRRHIPGIGAGIVPPLLQHARIDDVVLVEERDTARACRELIWEHGLLAGGSAGSVYAAVQQYAAARAMPDGSTVMFLCADGGAPYIDTVLDDQWIARLE